MAKQREIKFRNREGGQALVEFALMVVFLMLLIVGFIELIGFGYTYNVLADSAKEGVRYAIVHGTGSTNCSGPGSAAATPPITCPDTTGTNVKNSVTSYALYSLHNTTAMNVTTTYVDSSSAPPSRIRVTVSYLYQPFFGLGWPRVTVHAASEGRIMF